MKTRCDGKTHYTPTSQKGSVIGACDCKPHTPTPWNNDDGGIKGSNGRAVAMTRRAANMKISEWLEENIHSHGMYDAEWVSENLTKITGRHFKIGTFSAGAARSEIGKDPKGPEYVNEALPDHKKLSSGYRIAETVAATLLVEERKQEMPGLMLNGRGSRFRACIEALRKAGL